MGSPRVHPRVGDRRLAGRPAPDGRQALAVHPRAAPPDALVVRSHPRPPFRLPGRDGPAPQGLGQRPAGRQLVTDRTLRTIPAGPDRAHSVGPVGQRASCGCGSRRPVGADRRNIRIPDQNDDAAVPWHGHQAAQGRTRARPRQDRHLLQSRRWCDRGCDPFTGQS